MTISCRGIRGATTSLENSRDAILEATREMLEQIVQENESIGFANTMTAKVPADSHMSARITTSFEQEKAQGGLSNMMHNCSGGMNDDAASLKQPQTDFHVFSVIPLWVEAPSFNQRLSHKHRTWAICQCCEARPPHVFAGD